MTTITQNLRTHSPLTFTRPAHSAAHPARPQGTGDSVSLGNAPPPQEPDLREPKQGKTGLALGLAAGALAIVGAGLLIGGLHGPGTTQVVQEQQITAPQTTPDRVDRSADPISQDQWEQIKAIGTPRAQDNATAREVRESYQQVAEELLPEADLFQAQSKDLLKVAQRLEWAGKELGNGTHQLQGTTLTVELREDGITVQQQDGQIHRTVTRDGDYLTVEVNEGQGATRLEDGPDTRSITEGQTTRTLHLRSGILHAAGEFEVVTGSRSVQQTTRIDGTRIRRQTDQMVNGYAGRESIHEVEVWSAPEASIQMYPATSLTYSNTRASQNLTLQSSSSYYRIVEVRQDGSTHVKHNNTLEGTVQELDEAGVEADNTATPPRVIAQ